MTLEELVEYLTRCDFDNHGCNRMNCPMRYEIQSEQDMFLVFCAANDAAKAIKEGKRL